VVPQPAGPGRSVRICTAIYGDRPGALRHQGGALAPTGGRRRLSLPRPCRPRSAPGFAQEEELGDWRTWIAYTAQPDTSLTGHRRRGAEEAQQFQHGVLFHYGKPRRQASPLPVEGPSGRASVVTPSPPGQPGSLGRGSVSPSLPSTAPGQAGGRRSTARGSAWEGASPTEAAAVGVSPRLSRRLEQRASLAAVEPSGGEPRPPERGSVAGASPRRSYIKKASQSSSFDKWISNVKRSVKQQHELEIVQEHEKQNAVEETPMLAKSSKKAARKVIRDLSEIRRVFTHFDKDGSGLIEPCEFLPLLSKLLRQPVSEMDKTEVWKNWDQVDTDGSGQISWEEFQTWYCETFSIDISPDFTDFFSDDIVPTTERLIREVAKKTGSDNMCIESIYKQFTALDNDKSGHLDKAEFQILIERQITQGSDVQELPAKVLDKLWLDIDADGSGMVSFEEFAVWYLKFFLGDISPMEQYYKLLGSGFRSSMVQEMETPTE